MICVKRFLCGIVSVALVFSFLSFRFVDARENESIPHGQYLAHYFDNPKLQEPSCYEQIDHRIKFDWHSEGPHRLREDGFSIRWQGYFDFKSCVYLFHFTSDDGIRVWIDDEIIIDYWSDHAAEDLYTLVDFEEDTCLVTCEYYENDGLAEVMLEWDVYQSIKKENPKTNITVLPLLVEFSDVNHIGNLDELEDSIFSSDANDCSLQNFFSETSEGAVNITEGSYGIGQWMKIPYRKSSFHGRWSSESNDMDELIKRIYDTLDVSNIDLSEYDCDNDKILDHVIIMCAGIPESDSIFWYHWGYSDNYVSFDGYQIKNYIMVREISNKHDYESLRILCHEFYHSLGGEDLYSYINRHDPIGPWDIMGTAANWNFGLSGYSRYYLGWLEPTYIHSSGEYVINALGSKKENQLFRINIPCTDEYLLIENRQKITTDSWWYGIPEEGLVIYHIDDSIPTGFRFNDGLPAYRNFAVQVKNPSSYTTYCKENSRIRFTPYTSPSSKDYHDYSPFEIYITDISESGMKMSFSVEFRKIRPFPSFQPQTLNLGKVGLNDIVTEEIQITNVGNGVLFCQVDTTDYWITVDETDFLDNDIVIKVTFNLSKTTAGRKKERIYVKNSDGRVYSLKIKLTVLELLGDLNKDDRVDQEDYSLFMDSFGSKKGEKAFRFDADFNEDQVINFFDLYRFAKSYDTER
jgi:M6 family metalloprotease-like protein